MEVDKHAKEHGGQYTVRSIYFDTPDFDCYFDKMAGVKRRNKVRLRGYNGDGEAGTVFFEIKKKVDEPLYKNRAPTTYGEAKQILEGEPVENFIELTEKTPLAQDNARRFMYHLHARRMQPVVTVIYEREPYQAILKDVDNDLRITFDKNLRAVAYPDPEDLFEEKCPVPVDGQHFIMEIKFNRYLPTWVKAVVNTFGLTKGPASKYVLSVDAMHLAGFKWLNG